MAARAPGVFGQHFQAQALLGCPAQGQELGSMILIGPFQLSLFYDSVILFMKQNKNLSNFQTDFNLLRAPLPLAGS